MSERAAHLSGGLESDRTRRRAPHLLFSFDERPDEVQAAAGLSAEEIGTAKRLLRSGQSATDPRIARLVVALGRPARRRERILAKLLTAVAAIGIVALIALPAHLDARWLSLAALLLWTSPQLARQGFRGRARDAAVEANRWVLRISAADSPSLDRTQETLRLKGLGAALFTVSARWLPWFALFVALDLALHRPRVTTGDIPGAAFTVACLIVPDLLRARRLAVAILEPPWLANSIDGPSRHALREASDFAGRIRRF